MKNTGSVIASASLLAAASLLGAGCANVDATDGASVDELRIVSAGAVYTLSNDAAANAVLTFRRGVDGALTPSATVLTGGRGTGAGLGSQGALALSPNRRWLFAVNAGSDEVSSFRVTGDALSLVSIVPSGGAQPVSLTLHDNLLYVLNAGGANVSGFTVDDDGALTPLRGSTRALSSSAAGPAQVQFNPDGDVLVVSEKAANAFDTFDVRWNGTLSAAHATASAGVTPFGFAFSRRGVMVVSDAAGGAAGQGTASSYRLSAQGRPEVLSGAVPSGQSAPCWVAIPREGDVSYVANTGSGDITAYDIDRRGRIALAAGGGVVANTGANSRPADLAVSPDDRFLYVLNGGNGTVGAYRRDGDDALVEVGVVRGLPAHPAGLVVR